jgi:hypothetical protein
VNLTLEEHGSQLSFDLRWEATAPAFEEAHHLALSNGRTTTDQTRYSQSGTATGWVRFGDTRYDVTPGRWWASRDHSWGIYADRPPLSADPRFLRRPAPTPRRALRFWTVFSSPSVSGFYGFHEDEHGSQHGLNDVFGTPFEGSVATGPDGPGLALTSVAHEATFRPGTTTLESARLELTDAEGRIWQQSLESVGMPWWPHPIGYGAGSWRDGGSMVTWAGTDETLVEWDDFDFSVQPFEHVTYDGRKVQGGGGHAEHLCRVTTTAPDGTVSVGAGQTELFVDPPYRPYGLA